MLIREANNADIPAILELLKGMDGENAIEMEEAENIWDRVCSYPHYKIYLAEDEKTALGTFSLIIIDNLGHKGLKLAVVENVIVNSKQRGNGIGTLMMKFAMEKAAEEHCYKLMLSSNKNRILAHRFYKNIGFKQHGISFAVGLGEI